jgi:hypothetical protein
LAKKGEKISQYTKNLMSMNRTKDKKPCKFCGEPRVKLEKHYENCIKNPENKERLQNRRKQREEKNKEKIKKQKEIVWKKWISIPENKASKEEYGKNYRQVPKNKTRFNEKRKVERPIKDQERTNCLFFIIGGYKCVKCGFRDHRGLEKDHIKDDGYLDNQRFSDDRSRDLYYVYHPEEAREKLQVLCSNCNAIKLNDQRVREWNLKNHTPRSRKDRENYQKLTHKAHQILGKEICKICNFKDSRAIDIEHIQGKGNKDRKQFSRRNLFLEDIIKNPEKARKKLQLICRNCNTIKLHIEKNNNCVCEKFHVKYFKNA